MNFDIDPALSTLHLVPPSLPTTVTRRIERGMTGDIRLMRSFELTDNGKTVFQVEGTAGNTYDVCSSAAGSQMSCSCLDYDSRQLPCKHIYFVLLQVLRVPLRTVTHLSPSEYSVNGGDLPWTQYKWPGQSVELREVVIGEDTCPICYDIYDQGDDVVYCTTTCGNGTHRKCFKKWAASMGPTCVYCRSLMGSPEDVPIEIHLD